MTEQQPTLPIKTPTQRWEDGDEHHPETQRLFSFLRDYDWKHGPVFDWRSGGDGDNGEELMYHLDAWFEQEAQK